MSSSVLRITKTNSDSIDFLVTQEGLLLDIVDKTNKVDVKTLGQFQKFVHQYTLDLLNDLLLQLDLGSNIKAILQQKVLNQENLSYNLLKIITKESNEEVDRIYSNFLNSNLSIKEFIETQLSNLDNYEIDIEDYKYKFY